MIRIQSFVILYAVVGLTCATSLDSQVGSLVSFHRLKPSLKTDFQNFRGGYSEPSEPVSLKDGIDLLEGISPRIITGGTLAILSTVSICSNKYIFAVFLGIISVLGQREYGVMVTRTGVPSNTILQSLISVAILFWTAVYPQYDEFVFPISFVAMSVYFFLFKQYLSSLQEVSMVLLGIVYLGLIPSLWIKIRDLGDLNQERFQFLNGTKLTAGALLVLWTWASVALADSGAYAVGRLFGSHKLASFSNSMGSASPRKTAEGAIGGVLASVLANLWAAHKTKLPQWQILGPLYGLMISGVAFFGDLLESLIKRSAGVKDSGTLLPGHGGVLDRMDSLLLTAPVAYTFWKLYFLLFREGNVESIF